MQWRREVEEAREGVSLRERERERARANGGGGGSDMESGTGGVVSQGVSQGAVTRGLRGRDIIGEFQREPSLSQVLSPFPSPPAVGLWCPFCRLVLDNVRAAAALYKHESV